MSRSLKQSFRKLARPLTIRRPRRAQLLVESLEERSVPAIMFQPQFGVEPTTNHNGIGLNDVPVDLIFWGSAWNNPPPGSPTMAAVTSAVQSVLDSPYTSGLTQYNVDGKVQFGGSYLDPSNPSTTGFGWTDALGVITHATDSPDAQGRQLPDSDDTPTWPIYVVVTAPGVTASAGGASYNGLYVRPNLLDADRLPMIWLGGLRPNGLPASASQIDQYTDNFSHELAEAITDIAGSIPFLQNIRVDAGANWTGGGDGQIADAEAQNYSAVVNGVLEQSYWSNRDQQYLVPTSGSQVFTVNNGVLTVNDDQLANHDDVIDLDVEHDGSDGIRFTVNDETFGFRRGQISKVIIQCHTGHDTVNVHWTVPDVPVDIYTGNDVMTVNFTPYPSDHSYSYDLSTVIQGQVTIHGNGRTTVKLNDQQGTSDTPFTYTVGSTSVTRTGMGTVTYSGVSSLELDAAGGGRKTINVENPSAPTTIVAGSDITQLNVDPTVQNLDQLGSALSLTSDGGLIDLAVFDQLNPHTAADLTTSYGVYSDHLTRTTTDLPGALGSSMTYADLHSLKLVTGTASANVVNVETIAVPTTIQGGAASNAFNVAPTSQNLDSIGAALTLDGGSGGAAVTVYDQANPWTSRLGVSTSYNLSPAGPNYSVSRDSTDQSRPNGPHYATTITLSHPSSLTLDAGNNGNSINVSGSPTATSVQTLTVNAGNGNNVINVDGSAATTAINGGEAQNTVNVSPTAHNLDGIGQLTVDGGTGQLSLVVNDQANPRILWGSTATVYTIDALNLTRDATDTSNHHGTPPVERARSIAYARTQNLTLNAGNTGNQINVTSTSAATTVNAGTGHDVITVGGPSDGMNGVGQLTVAANGGRLVLDDRGTQDASVRNSNEWIRTTNDAAFTVTDRVVTRTAHEHYVQTILNPHPLPHQPPGSITTTHDFSFSTTINYSGASRVEVTGGPIQATFAIQSTASGTPVAVTAGHANAGTFTVGNAGSVKGIRGALTLTGAGAASGVSVDDSASTTRDQVTTNATSIGAAAADQFFGAGGSLSYSNLGSVAALLSNAFDDTVNLAPAASTSFALTGSPSAFRAGHGAVLNVDTTGATGPVNTPSTPGAGQWTFGNRQAVTYANFAESVHNVTAQLSISRGSIVVDPVTRHYKQTVTLRNTGGSAMVGPLSLVLDGLTAGVRLVNRTGVTARQGLAGSSYVDVALTNNVLNVGTGVSVVLEFDGPSVLISYQARVLAGTGAR
jgi:hypothetical protein